MPEIGENTGAPSEGEDQPKMTFRLIRGTAQIDGKTYKAKGGANGNVIETTSDLVAKFGAGKFIKLQGPKSRTDTHQSLLLDQGAGPQKTNAGPAKPLDSDGLSDGLENMTIDELRRLASENAIDLGTATRKADIVSTIRERMPQ